MIGTHCDAALAPGPGAELVFRVRAPSRQGQIVRLRSPKCSVGSGPQCTLRLRARGVRAVHCLILRGRAATLVRRWAPDTRLNGRAFLDQPLEPGDLLSIGPVDLEVVSLGSSRAVQAGAEPRTAPAAPPAGPVEPTKGQAAGHAPPADQADRRPHSAAGADAEALAALRRQQAALDGQQTELRQRELACRNKEQALAAQAEQLESDRATLAAQSEQLTAERNALAAQAEQLRAERAALAAEVKRLEDAAAELDTRRERLEADRSAWDSQQADTNARCARQSATLDRRTDELEQARDDLDRRRREWEAEQTARAQELDRRAKQLDTCQQELDQREKYLEEQQRLVAERAAQLDARQQELDDLAERLESQRRELESPEPAPAEPGAMGQLPGDAASEPSATSDRPASPTDELVADSPAQPTVEDQPAAEQALAFEEPSEQAPVELSAVLRRMGAAPLVPDDEPDASSASAPETSISGPTGNAAHAPSEESPADDTGEADDEGAEEAESGSIDLYMAGLLQRSRGWVGPNSGPQGEAGARAADDARGPGQPPQGQVSWRSRTKRREHDPARPRAPESEVGLSAMRQLASQAARAAIDSHARRETIRARRVKLAVALTGLVLGILLLAMWQRGAAGTVAYYGGLVGLVIALVWGLQYALLSGRLTVNRFGSLDLNKPDPDAAEPVPSGLGEPLGGMVPAARDPGLSNTQRGSSVPTADRPEPQGESDAGQ